MKKGVIIVLGGVIQEIFIEGESVDFYTINYDTNTFTATACTGMSKREIDGHYISAKAKAKEMAGKVKKERRKSRDRKVDTFNYPR